MANIPGLSPENLPAELIERIVSNLDLPSIKHLRLTSRLLGRSSLGPHFKSHFAQQTTDLSQASLDRLRALAAHEQLGPAVKHLKIMSTTCDRAHVEEMLKSKVRRVVEWQSVMSLVTSEPLTDEDLTKLQADLDWMVAEGEKRRKLDDESVVASLAAALQEFGKLDSIDLNAHVLCSPDTQISTAKSREWRPVWARAKVVFRLAMSAIARSGVAVHTLTVYRDTPRCSVPAIEVTAHLASLEAEPNFAVAAASIKSFALSMATRTPTEARNAPATTTASESFKGVTSLLRHMRNLESIHIYLYNTVTSVAEWNKELFFQIATQVSLPHLARVSLGGTPFAEESMLQFLQNHPNINHLSLMETKLLSGSWTPIFAHICQMPNLTSLHASTLWGPRLVNLLQPRDAGEGRYKAYSDRMWCLPCSDGRFLHTRAFTADDLRDGIQFRELGGYILGSWPGHCWRMSRTQVFGPP